MCRSIKLFDVQHAEHEGRSLVVARDGRQLHIYDANDFWTRKGWLGRGIRALASFEAFNSKRCDIIRLAVANGITHVVCFTQPSMEISFGRLLLVGTDVSIAPSVFTIDAQRAPPECRSFYQWFPVPNDYFKDSPHHPGFAFVCSIYPHRVATFNYAQGISEGVMQLMLNTSHLASSHTVIAHEPGAEYFMQLLWPWGKPIPATTPILITGGYGPPRYLSLFSSHVGRHTYWGAYLFDTKSPFGITNFPKSPLKNDPPIRPSGCVALNSSLLVSVPSGQIVEFPVGALIPSHSHVESEKTSELYVHQVYNGKIDSNYYNVQFFLENARKGQESETLFLAECRLPGVMRNPAFALVGKSTGVLLHCVSYNKIRYGLFQCEFEYFHVNFSDCTLGMRPHVMSPKRRLVMLSHTTDFLYADDMRLFFKGVNLYGLFNRVRPRVHREKYVFESFFTKLETTKDSETPVPALMASPPYLLNVTKHYGRESQKNWVPFDCDEGHCFVTSLDPFASLVVSHHALSKIQPELDSWRDPLFNVDVGEVVKSPLLSRNHWNFGELRGGTQALLVHSPFGLRFLTFFHSSKERGNKIKTYYSGACLFKPQKPYGLTHISKEPFAPRSFYNISQTWAHRGLDFVVFPMSFIVDEEKNVASVLFGVQDRMGFMVHLSLSALFNSLDSVQ